MSYGGPIPQAWVDGLANHLSKDNNGGKILAEQWCRDHIEAATALFEGTKEERKKFAAFYPVSVITGRRMTGEEF